MLSIELALIGAAVLLLVLFSTRALAPARCIGCYCALKTHNAYAFCPDCLADREAQAEDKARAEARAEQARKRCYNDYVYTRPSVAPKSDEQWAKEIIAELGYRTAARQNHPDRGGSHEKMIALNLAYEQMKGARNASSL